VELFDSRTARSQEGSVQESAIRVLIVQDDSSGAQLLERMLRGHERVRFECERVSRLGAGMRLLADGEHQIILTDLSLPDARGLDAVAGLKRAAPAIPIVVIGGAHDEDLAALAVKAGAQDYLVEDEMTRQTLRRTIRYAIERKSTEEHLAYLAHHDQLTGLANRSLFARRASSIIARACSRGVKPALLLLDLDRFKNTNDILGHSVGDLLLVQVAERLQSCLENPDAIARLGGDEFAVLIEQDNSQEEASVLAQRLLDSLRPNFEINGHSIAIGASIGITVFPENGNDIEQLLQNADSAMYRAKDSGRNRYRYFDEEMHIKAVQWMEIEREIRGALGRDEFELHYQPQVDCTTNEIVCFEALLRWTHHALGPVGPFRFVPVLEDIGLIGEVGAWVLRKACLQLAIWRETDPDLRMAVNVSGGSGVNRTSPPGGVQ
jgi:diguanylate cyclase (GGDEF)-like protein